MSTDSPRRIESGFRVTGRRLDDPLVLVAALVVVNVLTANGMMPARQGWDAAIANDPRSYITFGLLALPPLVSLVQLAQIRRALQLVPTITRSAWDVATEPIRLVVLTGQVG